MADYHNQKVTELLKHAAAAFLLDVSNSNPLITVTDAKIMDNAKLATIFITVFPVEKEEEALDFVKRKRSEFKHYLKDNARLRVIPFVDFKIDVGEKNRQKIDELMAGS